MRTFVRTHGDEHKIELELISALYRTQLMKGTNLYFSLNSRVSFWDVRSFWYPPSPATPPPPFVHPCTSDGNTDNAVLRDLSLFTIFLVYIYKQTFDHSLLTPTHYTFIFRVSVFKFTTQKSKYCKIISYTKNILRS